MKPILVCLHGWGGSKESFTELRSALKDVPWEIVTPDLPGFGEAAEPPRAWTVDDYADWVEHYIASNISHELSAMSYPPMYLLGHSHGGRIALKLASRKSLPISHLFLCAPAGIKHGRHIRRIIGLTLAKCGKFVLSIPGLRTLAPLGKKLLYKLVRVHDYEQASPVMRQTLINVSREDLRPILPSIVTPVDLFWGTDDAMTPYSDAKIMERELKHATLHTYPGIRHRVHRDCAMEIAVVIKKVIQSFTQKHE